jgi:hypothetical protein
MQIQLGVDIPLSMINLSFLPGTKWHFSQGEMYTLLFGKHGEGSELPLHLLILSWL